MRPNKARFVTACQQILALGAVVAVLAPAANVISLDVATSPGAADVPQGTTGLALPGAGPLTQTDTKQPGTKQSRTKQSRTQQSGTQPSGTQRSGTTPGAAEDRARVETEPVESVVNEFEMTAATSTPEAGQEAAPGKRERSVAPRTPSDTAPEASAEVSTILSNVEKVTGYGAIGVTWESGKTIDEDQIVVSARTRTDNVWSDWTPVDFHDDHSPDAADPEANRIRPGTDPLLVGEVDEVQARVVLGTGVQAPDGIKLAVISPGTGRTDVETPAIDTSDSSAAAEPGNGGDGVEFDTSDGKVALQAGSFTSKPKIYSRAQWGANESMRDPRSLRYNEVHAGFVHHTVNSNTYTREQVPGIVRSIYAYHTQSKGWSDVGYNFLVDKFGRIWEGRYGGVDRPAVGAHTLGYNDYAFAMSAIGNFETTQPPDAVLDAYARLFAWKLSLHGIDAASTSQRVGSRTFPAINGHRDAGSTACPGKYLYAKIPVIRSRAAQYQADWSGRSLATDVVASAYPDILLRRASDKVGFALPTEGMLRWKKAVTSSTGWSQYDQVVATPDVTGDGHSDLLVRSASDGTTGIRPGNGSGQFSAAVTSQRNMVGFDQITAVGNLDKVGGNDFVARNPQTGYLHLFRGRSGGKLRRNVLSKNWRDYDLTVGVGDVSGDSYPDIYARDSKGVLWFHAGTGKKALKPRVKVAGNWAGFDVITGLGDMNGDRIGDLYVRDAAKQKAYVYPGKGDGTFGHRLGGFGRIGNKTNVSVANVTGSSDPDVVARRGDSLQVIAHRGTQNVSSPVRTTSARQYRNADTLLNVGDWDRDGHGDMIIRNAKNAELLLIRGLGNNRFAAPTVIGNGWSGVGLLAAVGDATGDGFPDLMGQPRGSSMRTYPGAGKQFKSSFVARSPISAIGQYGIGRWNADGAPDSLFRVGNSLVMYAGNGPGGLSGSPVTLTGVNLAPYDWVIGAGDVDRNGRPDLVVRRKSDGTLWLLSGRSRGFAEPKFLAEGFSGYDLAG